MTKFGTKEVTLLRRITGDPIRAGQSARNALGGTQSLARAAPLCCTNDR